MNAIAFHVASGDAYFSGSALLLVGLAFAAFGSRLLIRSSWVVIIIGLILIAISSTSFPVAIYAASAIVLVAWIALSLRRRRLKEFILGLIVMVASLTLYQIAYKFPATWKTSQFNRVVVVGDSISAGLNEPENLKWPNLIASQHSLAVVNCSKPGATTGSIIQLAEKNEFSDSLVIIEIGGNDVFAGRRWKAFDQDLHDLLSLVSNPNNQIYMVELPLPPFYDRFNQSQRALAKQFNARLIPRRDFVGPSQKGFYVRLATSDGNRTSEDGRYDLAACFEELRAKFFVRFSAMLRGNMRELFSVGLSHEFT